MGSGFSGFLPLFDGSCMDQWEMDGSARDSVRFGDCYSPTRWVLACAVRAHVSHSTLLVSCRLSFPFSFKIPPYYSSQWRLFAAAAWEQSATYCEFGLGIVGGMVVNGGVEAKWNGWLLVRTCHVSRLSIPKLFLCNLRPLKRMSAQIERLKLHSVSGSFSQKSQ
jgi:hypothetical protein